MGGGGAAGTTVDVMHEGANPVGRWGGAEFKTGGRGGGAESVRRAILSQEPPSPNT